MTTHTHAKHYATVYKASSTAATPNAKTSIVIGLDTAYIVGQGGGRIGQGIYMFDDQTANGSQNEGTLELSTRCHVGDIISFECMPLDPTRGDTCTITGFNVSQGNVFNGPGYPGADRQPVVRASDDRWLAIYQIFVQITTGGIRPTKYNLSCANWYGQR